jgi:hypothetical protein
MNQYKWFEKEIMEKEFIGYNEAWLVTYHLTHQKTF